MKTVGFSMVNCHRDTIDWSFINDDARFYNDSITKIYANCAPPGFFTHLANIDTMFVQVDDYFWDEGNRIFETTANHLCIVFSVDYEHYEYLHDNLRGSVHHGAVQKVFNVETVQCFVTVTSDTEEYNLMPTFFNDSSAWNKIKEWLLPIVEEYSEVLRSAI